MNGKWIARTFFSMALASSPTLAVAANAYEILNVDPSASSAEVKDAANWALATRPLEREKLQQAYLYLQPRQRGAYDDYLRIMARYPNLREAPPIVDEWNHQLKELLFSASETHSLLLEDTLEKMSSTVHPITRSALEVGRRLSIEPALGQYLIAHLHYRAKKDIRSGALDSLIGLTNSLNHWGNELLMHDLGLAIYDVVPQLAKGARYLNRLHLLPWPKGSWLTEDRITLGFAAFVDGAIEAILFDPDILYVQHTDVFASLEKRLRLASPLRLRQLRMLAPRLREGRGMAVHWAQMNWREPVRRMAIQARLNHGGVIRFMPFKLDPRVILRAVDFADPSDREALVKEINTLSQLNPSGRRAQWLADIRSQATLALIVLSAEDLRSIPELEQRIIFSEVTGQQIHRVLKARGLLSAEWVTKLKLLLPERTLEQFERAQTSTCNLIPE